MIKNGCNLTTDIHLSVQSFYCTGLITNDDYSHTVPYSPCNRQNQTVSDETMNYTNDIL